MVTRAEIRRRVGALVVLTLTAILGLGATLGAFTAAYRTQHAYPDYVHRANVADLVVNPSLLTTDVDAALRTLPHVRHVWSDGLLEGDIDDGHPRTAAEFSADSNPSGEMRGSSDGRFVDGDRLIVTSGRVPSGHRELFVSDEYRARYEARSGRKLALGDVVPLAFVWPMALEPDSGVPPNQKIKPIGVERVRVVGFGRLPDEVLQDDEFPRQRLVVSPDIDARYDCIPKLPKGNASRPEVFAALFPQDCTTEYRFYALDVDDPRNVPTVEHEIAERAAVINKRLPEILTKNTFVVRPIITTRADQDQRVQHAIRPTVVALTLFGVLAALATLAIIGLAVARIMRQTRQTNETALALGMRRSERIVALSLPYVPVAGVAVVASTALAYAVSRLAPVGEVRRVVGHASSSLPPVETGLVLLAFLLLFTVAVVASAALASRSSTTARRRGRKSVPAARALERGASPAVAQGIRSATAAGRGATLLIAASCVAVAALTASIVFGSSLVALVDSPQRYGWPWDVAVLTNFGYGGLDQAKVQATLSARHDIESYDELGFFSAQIKGKSVPVLLAGQDARTVNLPIIAGRAPKTFAEVALGSDTAAELGAKIGDRLAVEYGAGPKKVRENVSVVGTAVFPSIGQFLADRTGLGHGLFTVVPPSRIASSQSGSDIDYTFVGIKLKPNAKPSEVANALRPLAAPWDTNGQVPFVYSAQIRPPEIRNAEGIRNGPVLLAGLLGLALLVALALAIAVSVNERRRELGVLRAVGFTRSQLRRSVRWQALTTVAIGIVIGLPVGVIAGRWSWRVFADELGISPDAAVPVLALTLMAAIVVMGALVAAARPAYVAARTRPADALRSQ